MNSFVKRLGVFIDPRSTDDSTVRCSTSQHSTAQYSTVQYSTCAVLVLGRLAVGGQTSGMDRGFLQQLQLTLVQRATLKTGGKRGVRRHTRD